ERVAELGRAMGLFLNTAAMGAWGTLQAATGQVKSGGYYGAAGFRELRGPSRECSPSEQARNPQLAKRLWDVSVAMTGIHPGLLPIEETALRGIQASGVRYGRQDPAYLADRILERPVHAAQQPPDAERNRGRLIGLGFDGVANRLLK